MPAVQSAPVRPTNPPFCAEYSRTADEQLFGTVKPIDLWLLIEFRGRWEHEAVSVFSPTVQLRIKSLRSQFSKFRLALIKQTQRTRGPCKMFWAFSREQKSILYQTEFIDIENVSFEPDNLRVESAEPLYAVCTHGTHDLCCAQFGNKIFAELSSLHNNAWQISHIGGCRFAPNVVCLPDGAVYGRVEQRDIAAIINSSQHSSVFLPKLRGRSCLAKPVQAAEYFVRKSTNLLHLDELILADAGEIEPGKWGVTFHSNTARTMFQVSLHLEETQIRTFKSCATTEPSFRESFHLDNLQTTGLGQKTSST